MEILLVGVDYPSPLGEFEEWFATDAVAWTTWNGCVGQQVSPVGSVVLAAGDLATGGGCVRGVPTGRRSPPARYFTGRACR